MKLISVINKYWHDPVWSKVIATCIIAVGVSLFENIFTGKFSINWKITLSLAAVIFTLVFFLKKNKVGKYDTQEYMHDSEQVAGMPSFALLRRMRDYIIEVPEDLKYLESNNSLLYFFKKYYSHLQLGIPSSPTNQLEFFLRTLIVPALKAFRLVKEVPYAKSGAFPEIGSAKLTEEGIRFRSMLFVSDNLVVSFKD